MTLKHPWFASTSMTSSEQRLGRFLRAPEGHPDGAEFANAFDAAAAAVVSGDAVPPASDAASTPDPTPPPTAAPDVSAPGGEPAAPAPEAAPVAPADGAASVPTAPAVPGAEGTPPAAAPAPESPPAPVTPPAAPAPVAPATTAEDVLSRLAEALNKPAAPAAPAPTVVDETPLYSSDEIELLTQYEKDWPDVNKAETLKRRAEYTDLLKFAFTEVDKQLAPLRAQLATMGNTMHLGEVKQLVPDYTEDLEDKVAAWADTQPEYLRAAYKQVIQTGTSEEIADLIGRYRASAGVVSAPAAPAAVVPAALPAKPATELSSAAIQAADSLAPVGSERTQIPEGQDPQNYETAFAKYAAEVMPT